MQGIEVLFMGNNMLRLWGGLWVTLRLSLISIALSLVIGVFVGALMLVKNPVVKVICRVYIEIVRIMPARLAVHYILRHNEVDQNKPERRYCGSHYAYYMGSFRGR